MIPLINYIELLSLSIVALDVDIQNTSFALGFLIEVATADNAA